MATEAERFYAGFSHDVGLRDWAIPNSRHEQLRLILRRLLAGRRGLRILDVGCGAGVLSSELVRYGQVDGVDLSARAVALAGALVPAGRFQAGRLEELGLPGPYDLITLFDVLEHVPRDERHVLLASLRDRLRPGGMLFASTPQGEFTRWLLEEHPELAQAVEVEVDAHELIAEARPLGFELAHYEVYELQYARQYQAFAFVLSPPPPGGPPSPPPALRRRAIVAANPVSRAVRRVGPAWRLGRAGGPRAGLGLLLGRAPSGRPDEHR